MSKSAIVLVVDDETDLAETCARLLRRRGDGVVTADVRDALERRDA